MPFKDEIGVLGNIEKFKSLSIHETYDQINQIVDHDINNVSLLTHEKQIFTKANEELDKYYTKQSVANQCYEAYKYFLIQAKKKLSDILWIEPSAGAGVFLDVISSQEDKLGFDIAPTRESKHSILKNDFLNDNLLPKISRHNHKELIFIGNPPFGKKASLAIDFINKSLEYGKAVGFIIPIQFRKWSAQSKINEKAQLVLDMDLQENAFEFMGKDYNVRCCFQIWILDGFTKKKFTNLRMASKPDITHPDFELYQYNRTEEAKKFFDYDWDFAVPRQGYLDYTTKAYSKDECNEKHQWIFFKAKNDSTLKLLKEMDFEKLSKKNIGIPGFGKADVIQAYKEYYIFFIENEKRKNSKD